MGANCYAIMSIRIAWIILVLLHATAIAAGWRFGFAVGLAAMFAVHFALISAIFLPVVVGIGCGIRRFQTQRREVCITIDDGPTADTEELLSILSASNARAVFFLIGERVAANPTLCRKITAAGHVVGNHTQTHSTAWFWSFLPAAQMREIVSANGEIEKACGVKPRIFRAPVGFRNLFNACVLRALGMRHVGWSARGFDGTDSDIERVVRRIMRGLNPGAIILLHQGRPHHTELLRRLLAELYSCGWSVVVPDELH